MTTVVQALAAVKARLTAAGSGITVPLRFQNEDAPLPDTPAAFAYVELVTDRARIASYGGGRGQNRYRNPGAVAAYVFAPRGEGAEVALGHAETIAARLRSFRDADISCFEATVYPLGDGSALKPPGLTSEVGNYWVAVAETDLFFDLIG